MNHPVQGGNLRRGALIAGRSLYGPYSRTRLAGGQPTRCPIYLIDPVHFQAERATSRARATDRAVRKPVDLLGPERGATVTRRRCPSAKKNQ